MRLEKVKIINFCSCQSLELDLTSFNPIVGYNNSGKSNILKAVNWLLKKSVMPKTSFFDVMLPLTVEGTISNVNLLLLPANQQAQVSKYVINGELKFRRRQDEPDTTAAKIKIDVYSIVDGWVDNPTGLDVAIGVLFPDPIYIEAMKDASEDVSKFSAKNTIGLLLKYTLKQIELNNGAALTTLQTALDTVTSHMTGPNRIQEFNNFEVAATTEISNFFPGISLHLKLFAPDVDDLMKGATVSLSEGGGEERGFSSYGHGAQRSVQMALIRLLAKQAQQQVDVNAPTIVLLIDEPELYLHPQAIEILRDSLKLLSNQNFQIIFSTHSPLLIAKDDVLNANLIYKEQSKTKVRKKLSTASSTFAHHAHQASVTFSLQHSTYLLFSESVLVIEGKTEKMLLPELYKLVKGQTLGLSKLCLVEAGSSSSVHPIMGVLTDVGYRPKALVDLDYIFKEAPKKGLIDSATNQDFIECINWFKQNVVINNFNIDADGLPTKKGTITTSPLSASEVYELLAVYKADEIQRLAEILKSKNIWVWKRGAIEAHLGVQKNDADRMTFLHTMSDNANLNHAADSDSLIEFITWL